jgi:hypothetical protein
MSATWGQFREAQPDMAARCAHLLKQYGVAMAFIATVRKDGGPRLHPCCPAMTDSGLYVFIPPRSPKNADLRRDSRFALHMFLPDQGDEEFYVAGTSRVEEDPEVREVVLASHHYRPPEHETLFELRIERALHTTWENWAKPDTRPIYTRWRAP